MNQISDQAAHGMAVNQGGSLVGARVLCLALKEACRIEHFITADEIRECLIKKIYNGSPVDEEFLLLLKHDKIEEILAYCEELENGRNAPDASEPIVQQYYEQYCKV